MPASHHSSWSFLESYTQVSGLGMAMPTLMSPEWEQRPRAGGLCPPAFPSWEGLLLGAQPEGVKENLYFR